MQTAPEARSIVLAVLIVPILAFAGTGIAWLAHKSTASTQTVAVEVRPPALTDDVPRARDAY